MPVEHYPLGLQTTYRDLLDRHSRRPVPEVPGSIILTTNNGNRYWVAKQRIGTKVLEHRIGPDTDEVRQRAERLKAENHASARWSSDAAGLVAQLRAARMPVPTAGTGKLINALAKASFFRSGGVLAGTHAFGLYALELGIRLENALAQTEDVDIAADRNVRVIAGAGASLTSSLDGIGLSPVGGPMDSRPVRWETPDGVVLDILTPRRRTADPIVRLAGLGVWAQALPFLEFSLKDPIEAVVLYREGLAVRIPSPERFAVHKLIVASTRTGTHRAKSEKDLMQACALIEALTEARPFELAAAYREALEMGPKWRAAIEASLKRRPELRSGLDDVAG